jgi:hypothetical protein
MLITMNLSTKIKATRAQFLKYVIRAMVDVGMNSMPLRIVAKKVCL